MTFTQTRAPSLPCLAEPAPPPLQPCHPGFISFAQRAAMENAAMQRATGHSPHKPTNSGATDARKAWAAQLPDGTFTANEMRAIWGIRHANTRLDSLVAVGLLERTPRGKVPVRYWRAAECPQRPQIAPLASKSGNSGA
jgi:hypothetical protein